ncbi:MAG TPA: hypothetical protein PKW80_12560, partial [Bacteroidales bacterium]|nr:hypothetical protein [Bacteroidales bacterium]
NAVPAAVSVSGAGTFCGSTTITASGGTGGTIYYQGTTSGGTSTATPASSYSVSSSGTYYFRSRSSAGCWGTEGSASVTINSVPAAVSVSGGGTFCGSTTITASGGTGGTIYYQGTTSNGTSTATPASSYSVSSSGTYYFRSRSAAGCWSTQGSAAVTINTVPAAVSVSGAGTYCGSATITASGGTGGTIYYQGTTSNGTSTANSTNPQTVSSSGTYYFRSRSSAGCWSTQGSAAVTINAVPAAVSVSGAGTYCGSATITASGGTGGTIYYQGTTSGGTSTATPASSYSVSATGTYYFRSRSSAGCWGSEGSAAVTINPVPAAVSVSGGGTYCGSATITATGGTGGTIYYQGTTSNGTSTANSSNPQTVSSTGTYYFRSRSSAGCWGTEGSTSVTINALPGAVTVFNGGTQCDGSRTLTASGGTNATIYWQGTTSNGTSTGAPSTNQSVSSSGTYYFRAYNTSCGWGTQGSAAVTINPSPGAVAVNGAGTYCDSKTLTATGGTNGTIYWQGTTSGGTSTGTPTTSYSVTTSGTYYFRAYNANCGWGTQNSASVTMNYSSTAPTGISGTTTICSGGSTTLTQSGGSLGTGGIWYWYSGSCGGAFISSGSASITVSPGSTTSYFVRAQGTCNTTTCASTTITVNNVPGGVTAYNGGTQCDGSRTLTASGGTNGTIYWQGTTSNGTNTLTPSTNQSVSSSGTYYFRPHNGCGWGTQGSASVTINASSVAPTGITIGNNGTCYGSTKTLTVTGGNLGTGASWQWYTVGCGTTSAGSGTSINVNPSSNTTYYVRAVGTCNSTTCASNTVTVPTPTLSNSGPTSACSYQNISYTATPSNYVGTVSYQWYISNVDNSTIITCIASQPTGNAPLYTSYSGGTSQTLTINTFGGSYNHIHVWCVATFSGCTNSATSNTIEMINYGYQNQTISGTTPLCVGGTATWSGTTTGGTWSSSATSVATVGSSSGVVTGVSAGTATITYTLSNGTCTMTATKTVTIQGPPNQTITGATPICVGSTASWSSTTAGGTWSSSATSVATVGSTSGVVSGIANGTSLITYSVTASSCTKTATKTVTVSNAGAIGTWLGGNSNSWNTASNWAQCVIPTSTTDVIIPSGCTYYPASYTSAPVCRNLTIQSGGSMTLNYSAWFYVYGNFTVNSGGIFYHNLVWNGSNGIDIAGDLVIDGTYSYTGSPLIQMSGSGTHYLRGTNLYYLVFKNGDFFSNGTVSCNGNCWPMFGTTGSVHTNGYSFTANAGLYTNGGTVYVDGGSLNVTGGINVGYSGLNGALIVSSGTVNCDNFKVGDGTRTGTVTHSGGTVNVSNDLTVNISCSYTCSGSPAIYVGRNWKNNGTFTCATSSVTFNGSSNSTIESAAQNFYYLYVNKSSEAALVYPIVDNVNTSYLRINSGTYKDNGYTTTMTGDDSNWDMIYGVNASLTVDGGGTVQATNSSHRVNVYFGGSLNVSSGTFHVEHCLMFDEGYLNISGGIVEVDKEFYGQNYDGLGSGGVLMNMTNGLLRIGGDFLNSYSEVSSWSATGGTTEFYDGGYSYASDFGANSSVYFYHILLNKSITANRSISVRGNWTNIQTFTAGSYTVTFDGSSLQTLYGNTTTFYNVTLNNAAGATLAVAENVSGVLNFTSGKLNTTTSNILTITNTSTGAATGADADEYVNGPMRWSLASGSAYTFPVGNGGGYYPFNITPTGTPQIQVQANNSNCGGTADGTTLSSLSTTEYWAASIVSGSITGATVGLTRPSAITPLDVIGRSSTSNGTYSSLCGTPSTYSITNSNTTGSSLGYFVMAKCPAPSAGTVSGTTPLCPGNTTAYSVTGVVLAGGTGAWSSSSTGIASVASNGTVTAVAAGTANIIYTVTSACGSTASAYKTLTVTPNAVVTSVTGTSPLCIGASAAYTANGVVLGGGTGAWSSSSTAVATVAVNGTVTAVTAGSTNIIYTITGGCGGTKSALKALTVNPNAAITSVSGTTPL